MSAGKPLGSRAVLPLDLDFSFFRREKQAVSQRSPRWQEEADVSNSLPPAQRDVLVQPRPFWALP